MIKTSPKVTSSVTFKDAFVDADSMVWRAGVVTQTEPASHCLRIIKGWLSEIPADALWVGLSSDVKEHNYRYDVATYLPYKGNRSQPRPVHYKAAREYLINTWHASLCLQGEADDWVGSFGGEYTTPLPEDTTLIVSIDKDLDTVPGWHYNWVTKELYYLSLEDADYNFYWQTLVGDTVDNIRGLPSCAPTTRHFYGLSSASARGCGPKTASKILLHVPKEPFHLASECLAAYEHYVHWKLPKKPLDFQSRVALNLFLENADLLWIQREYGRRYRLPFHCDIDDVTGIERIRM